MRFSQELADVGAHKREAEDDNVDSLVLQRQVGNVAGRHSGRSKESETMT